MPRPSPAPLRELPAAKRLIAKRILIADDDAEIRKMLRVVLESVGAVALEAASAEEATTAARSGQVDAVVLDWHLAGQAADATVIALSAIDGKPRIPLLVITGDPRVVSRLPAPALGCAVLLKPFLPVDLVTALADAIDPVK